MKSERGGNLQAAGNFRIEVFRPGRKSAILEYLAVLYDKLKGRIACVSASPCLLMCLVPLRPNCIYRQVNLQVCGFSGHIPPSLQQPD